MSHVDDDLTEAQRAADVPAQVSSHHHNERIIEYMRRSPDVRSRYVAGIFGVSISHVDRLRQQIGAYDARKKAALARQVRAADLDKAILAAVYKRGLVDTVLGS